MLEWYEAVDALKPRMVRIATPVGTGSGFLLPWQSKSGLCAVATAAHVVDHAFYWEQPIRLDQVETGNSVLIRQEQRAIFSNAALDTAVIVFESGAIRPPVGDLAFVPEEKYLRVGNEVGWLGFPAITPSLCFFSGRISAWREDEKAYLIDGVAINGVSGGVVFALGVDEPRVVGVVSAYVPNRATGEVLPGLAIARDVSYLHQQATNFASLDEARSAQSIPEPPITQAVESEIPATPTRAG
ncbi:MAG: serine protease [Candidatus Competibacteraceae bacterium]